MSKNSEAVERYRKKHQIVEIKLRVPQQEKDKIWAYAKSKGKSLSGYIMELIEEDMRCDRSENDQSVSS